MLSKINSKYTLVGDTNIHYLIAGEGEPIFFIHGWPTSSYLWRNIMEELADEYQVVAIDLPGFGKSDKRIGDSYSFRYYHRIVAGVLDNLGIEKATLCLHDLGGPIGLYYLIKNMDKVNRLILLNTLVYPQLSWAVKLFGLATALPLVRTWLSSPRGIKWSMGFGVNQKEKLTKEIIQQYQAPFKEQASRKALLKSVQRLSIKGFVEIEKDLASFDKPVQVLFGEKDRILPKVGETMQRVKSDLPNAVVKSFADCGHFLQEEIPEQLSQEIKTFIKSHPIKND